MVHEMVHLVERTHNQRFITLMDEFMPRWRSYRNLLNRLPVRHEKWVIKVLALVYLQIDDVAYSF